MSEPASAPADPSLPLPPTTHTGDEPAARTLADPATVEAIRTMLESGGCVSVAEQFGRLAVPALGILLSDADKGVSGSAGLALGWIGVPALPP